MNIAIIVAGGKGKRMQSKTNKLLMLLNKEPIILHTLKQFTQSKHIDRIILVINSDEKKKFETIAKSLKSKKITAVVEGGIERQDSAYNGLKAIKKVNENDIILIHNAANPFINSDLLKRIIADAEKFGAAVAGFPAKDTIKVVKDGLVQQTIDRRLIWQAQTPQAAKYFLLKKAFDRAFKEQHYGTDDVSLIERIGGTVKMVECDRSNFKITDQYDLAYANKLVLAERIGIGQDSHRFIDKKPLVLGGIVVTKEYGFDANSDGDIILHALFNAISSALGMKSLGNYANSMFKKGITQSKQYLAFILEKMKSKNFKIGNVAIMLEGKKPIIDEISDKIKKSLSKILSLEEDHIGIAATSGEGLSEFGKGEGMQCFCVVTLRRT